MTEMWLYHENGMNIGIIDPKLYPKYFCFLSQKENFTHQKSIFCTLMKNTKHLHDNDRDNIDNVQVNTNRFISLYFLPDICSILFE